MNTYTVPEAADALSVSVATVWRLLSSGELSSFKVRGARRIAEDDLRAYIEANREPVA